ncbi:CoxG family protein [Virgibacillus halophilus]|uniref:SRPBCC family protein n=1 Tax=Tigheibacillus halophilus TaxID=361280 RepID=A0ABU5C346_9BACI|nr:SRPBCC family protein [Virgibacillus halophilus]
MPNTSHQLKLDSPLEQVWEFVSNVDNWAPLVKGYHSHHKLSVEQSIWTLKGEVGRIRKTMKIKIDIVEITDFERIAFRMKGITDNLHGSGSFSAKKLTEKTTLVTGELSIKANGLIGPMLNPLITSLLPRQLKELARSMCFQIEKQKHRAAIS